MKTTIAINGIVYLFFKLHKTTQNCEFVATKRMLHHINVLSYNLDVIYYPSHEKHDFNKERTKK